jgi:hypothetical protein
MEKDLHSKVSALLGLAVQVINTDTSTSGEIIDTALFESAVWAISSGTITAGDMAGAIWESDDSGMSGATVVPAAETLGAATWVITDDDVVRRIGSVGKKRYQQLRMVSTNSQNGADWVALVVLSDPRHGPVASTT